MTESSCDVLIVGGGVGGCAAALAAASFGHKVVLTEETDWIGGQLTSQAVPPDEHPWIESGGCTKRYAAYRSAVRELYRNHMPLNDPASRNPILNPGCGWVSGLCHEPRIGWLALNLLLQPALTRGNLDVRVMRGPLNALVDGDRVRLVRFLNFLSGEEEVVHAKFVLDATETGDLLPLTGTEYAVGAETASVTGERHAVSGPTQPENVQGLTWVAAVAHDEGSHRVIDRPATYGFWKAYKPPVWPGPLLGFEFPDPRTGERRSLPLFGSGGGGSPGLFDYRQIVDPTIFRDGADVHAATLLNWPQNDYFLGTILDVPQPLADERLLAARQLTLSLVYWLQTEAPRRDGGVGYPGLYLRPDLTGTDDGLAKMPYIRESRRILAEFTVREEHVSEEANPGRDRAPDFPDSVGIGAYRIDLHPSTNGIGYVDVGTVPFQIPLGALIPVRMQNLLPAGKNIGVTHVTNGCYRLHPVEWAIGEAAGALAGHCLAHGLSPSEVRSSPDRFGEFRGALSAQGIPYCWDEGVQLHPL